MSVHGAWSTVLLLALVGCGSWPRAPRIHCPPRTMPTVRLLRLHEVEIHRSLDLVRHTNRGRLAVLRSLFESFGCSGPELVETSAGLFRQPNLSCTLPGELPDRIVVGARYDVSAVPESRVDPWPGASLLPALRLSLSHEPRRHSFEFVAFSSDEDDPAGSSSFVGSLDTEEVRRIKAMVDVDGVGAGPLEAEVSHSDPELVCDFWATSKLVDVPLRARIAAPRASGEYEAFLRAGIPVIDLTSVTAGEATDARTRRSTGAQVDEESYLDSYRVLAVYLAMLDERLWDGDRTLAKGYAVGERVVRDGTRGLR